MSVLSMIAVAAEEKLAPLIMPNWAFPLIAIAFFVTIGLIMHSFRDVANRHGNKAQRAGGHDAAGHGAPGHTPEH